MHEYHDLLGSLPPGTKGCCWGTWVLFILPYIEQENLYNAWNFVGNDRDDETAYGGMFRYNGAANLTVTSRPIDTYYCPSDTFRRKRLAPRGVTSQNYVVNFGNTISTQTPFYLYHGTKKPFLGAPFTDMGAPDLDVTSDVAQAAHAGTVNFSGIIRRTQRHHADVGGGGRKRWRPPRLFVVGIRNAIHGPPDTQLVISRRITSRTRLRRSPPQSSVRCSHGGL